MNWFTKISVAAFILTIVIFGASLSSLQLFSVRWISPGWEIWNQVAALRHNDTIFTEESDFTSPRELMGNYWKVDRDDPNWGLPTLMASLGDIHHVDFTGRELPWNEPARELDPITRGNATYYLDYHIYTFTIAVRTLADKNRYTTTAWPLNVPVWEHETSWPHEAWAGPLDGDKGFNEKVGKMFKGGFYIKFVIDPWTGIGYRDPPEDAPAGYYWESDAWAGVMNAYVHDVWAGQVENQDGETPDPEGNAPMIYRGGLNKGTQVPMFADDGTFGNPAPTVDWNPNLSPDEDIETNVVLYLPVELQAGLKVHAGAFGEVDEIYLADVQVFYTARVDILTNHGFYLQGGEPPTPEPWKDYFTWAYGFWEGIFNWLGWSNPFRIFGDFGPFIGFISIVCVAIIFIWVGFNVLKFLKGPVQMRRITEKG
jgi:hypothetical protein